MNLVSCDNCAVILDGNKIDWPQDLWLDCGAVNEECATLRGDDWVPYVTCPVCEAEITEETD